MALMSIGTDTGGSIRCPASVCGVTGLKPTYGTVSRIGIFPLAWSLDTAGPIGRTVQDCVTAMAHLVGHDPRDPGSSPTMASVGGELGHKLDGLRIGLPRAFFYDRIEDGVAELMNAAAQTLARLGADIIEADWDLATEARAVSMVINRVETSAVHEQRVRRQADQVGDEWRLRVKAGLLMPAT
jgi:aspartyl-tRNA(Asn)/glutamyl-tRNA(Gln) amidotransferase subunit A